jgi:hypothetical protein
VEFSPEDHDRLARMDDVMDRLDRIEQLDRRLPARVARRVERAMTRRAAFLIAIGALVGSSLGGAAAPLVQRLVAFLVSGR